jgi:hypothetical protein
VFLHDPSGLSYSILSILKDTEEGHLLIGNVVNIFVVTYLSVSLHNLLDFYNLFCLCCIVMSRWSVTHLVLLLSNTFELFGLPMFRYWAHLMKVIPDTRRAHYIWCLRCYYIHDVFVDNIQYTLLVQGKKCCFYECYIYKVYCKSITITIINISNKSTKKMYMCLLFHLLVVTCDILVDRVKREYFFFYSQINDRVEVLATWLRAFLNWLTRV